MKVIDRIGQSATWHRLRMVSSLLVVVLLSVLIAIALNTASAAHSSADSVGELSDVLNRRSPVVEHLVCHEQAADPVTLAIVDYLEALIDAQQGRATPDDVAKARARLDHLVGVLAASPSTCPDAPTPGKPSR